MKPLLLNLAVALLWMLLAGSLSTSRFLAGYLIGFGLLALFQPVIDSGPYVRRSLAVLGFLGVLLRDYARSTARTLQLCLLTPRDRLQPKLLVYDVANLTRFERLLLAHAITLTPGSVVIDLDPRAAEFTIHFLDGADPDASRASLDHGLRHALLAFTR